MLTQQIAVLGRPAWGCAMFRFIHAADIHLDSPLRGLESYPDAPVEQIRGAARRAFDNLVDLAIDEGAAFVLLAGDLFDGDWKDYNTGLYFTHRMGRLRDAGIPEEGLDMAAFHAIQDATVFFNARPVTDPAQIIELYRQVY